MKKALMCHRYDGYHRQANIYYEIIFSYQTIREESSMIEKQKYRNFFLETLPHDKIRELQLKKFKRIFEWTLRQNFGQPQDAGAEFLRHSGSVDPS